ICVVTETPFFGKRSAGTAVSIAGTWQCAPASTRAFATAEPSAPVPPVMTTWQSRKVRMLTPRLPSSARWELHHRANPNAAMPLQRLDEVLRFEMFHDPGRYVVWRRVGRVESQLRVGRYFVRLIDPREVPDLAGEGSAIKPLRIAGDAKLERRVDEDFDEFTLIHQIAHGASVGSER